VSWLGAGAILAIVLMAAMLAAFVVLGPWFGNSRCASR